MAVSAVGAVVGVGSSVASAQSQKKSGKAQARAQAQANAIEQRKSDINNQRIRRQAAMQTVAGIASNQALDAISGASTSMAMGGNTAISSDFSTAIGSANTNLAANNARANAMQKGYDTALKYQNQANNWGVVSNLGSTVMGFAKKK